MKYREYLIFFLYLIHHGFEFFLSVQKTSGFILVVNCFFNIKRERLAFNDMHYGGGDSQLDSVDWAGT